jgi:hypothetical protein
MPKRHHSVRSIILASTLAIMTLLGTVATALADGGGPAFPK